MLNQFNVSLWGDEAFSAILSQKNIFDVIKIISRDTSPPLYNLLEHFWFAVFGNSEVAIRSLSFIFYLIAIYFTYKIASGLFGKKTAILASVLTFLNPFLFTYAFEGRMYSLLLATVLASIYFYITKRRIPFVIATAFALYTHHFAFFAVIIEGLWFLKKLVFNRNKELAREFFAFLAVGALYIPWVIPLYMQTKMVAGGFWLGRPTLSNLINLICKYLANGSSHFLSQYALFLALVIVLLRAWQKEIKTSLFLLLWALGPILIVFAISQKFTSVFYDRYMIYTIPAMMILLSSNKRALSKYLLLILAGMFLVIDIFYFTHPTKKPFRDLASYVKSTEKPGDYLINWNGESHHLWETKYYGIPAPIYVPTGAIPYFAGTALMTEGDTIKALPKNIKRIGVVTSDPVDKVTLKGYPKREVKTFDGLNFIWLSK